MLRRQHHTRVGVALGLNDQSNSNRSREVIERDRQIANLKFILFVMLPLLTGDQ